LREGSKVLGRRLVFGFGCRSLQNDGGGSFLSVSG
jgi:hypothetical protein